MSERAEIRFTISQLLMLVVGAALFLGLVLNRSFLRELGPVLALGLLTVLAVLGGLTVVESWMGITCPSCREGKMKRVSLETFGARYFRCDRCRARWKKRPFEDWEKVEEGEDAAAYARKSAADPWSTPPEMIGEEVAWSETHSSLLRNKLKRNPNAPRQEKQQPIE